MDKNIQRQKNADRFKGFADIYDEARPAMPLYPAEIITRYLGKAPETVIDLGCGTGLSSLIWQGRCKELIGIEPSEDMIAVAMQKAGNGLRFEKGFGNDTGLSSGCADAVVCSQSFHWMEPVSTLAEINRILRAGGVFATVDCDWPPVSDVRAEIAYSAISKKIKRLELELNDVKDTFDRYPKEEHLNNIKKSGYFKYCREILFSNTERCSAERLIKLLLSQGSFQTVMRLHPELINEDIENFKADIYDIFGESEFEIEFCYRMRIGIK